MRSFLLPFLFLLCTACSHSNMMANVTGSYPVFHDPLKFVEWIYTLPNPRFMIFENGRIRPKYYTARMVKLTAGRERCYKEEFHMDWLDFNYIVPGNDYNITNLYIEKLWQEDNMAKTLIMFDNLGEAQRLEYLLRREDKDKGWMIDDIFTASGSLSHDLSLWCAQ